MKPLPPQLKEKFLGEVKVRSTASKKDWVGYPPQVKKHKERNHPGFIRQLIKFHSSMGDRVHDPMSGAGTVMREAQRANRVGTGWDIREWCRGLVPHTLLMNMPEDESVDLIVTSPSYERMNHSPGKNAKSKETMKAIGSDQGGEWEKTEGFAHKDLCQSRNRQEWFIKLTPVLRNMWRMLKPGGRLVWIIKERVLHQKSSFFVVQNKRHLMGFGFEYVGFHFRRLRPSGMRQLQAKKFFQDTGKVAVYPSMEYALVFRKPGR